MALTRETVTLENVYETIKRLWPEDLAEDWDQVGIVTGALQQPVGRVLLAVDSCAATVSEAVETGADLLLTHHPMLLRGIHSVAEHTAKGALLTPLIRNNIAHIAAHTNADQPEDGVSAAIAAAFDLVDVEPIIPADLGGLGRVGRLRKPVTLREFAQTVSSAVPQTSWGTRVAGDPHQSVLTVALCGGAGDSLLGHPAVRSADVYVTSDLRHHPALESRDESSAQGSGPALIDISHWAAESLWLQNAQRALSEAHPELSVTISERNTDPWTFTIPGYGSVEDSVRS